MEIFNQNKSQVFSIGANEVTALPLIKAGTVRVNGELGHNYLKLEEKGKEQFFQLQYVIDDESDLFSLAVEGAMWFDATNRKPALYLQSTPSEEEWEKIYQRFDPKVWDLMLEDCGPIPYRCYNVTHVEPVRFDYETNST